MSVQAEPVAFLTQVHQMNRNLERKPTGNTFNEALAKRMKKDDIFTSDIIIAYVISRSLPLALFIQFIYVVSWAQLVQEKVVCVLLIFQRLLLA